MRQFMLHFTDNGAAPKIQHIGRNSHHSPGSRETRIGGDDKRTFNDVTVCQGNISPLVIRRDMGDLGVR